MSDLPNFKRSLLRRLGVGRVMIVSMILILAAIAWSRAGEFPDELEFKFRPIGTAMIGQLFQYAIEIKNNGALTTDVDVQVAFSAIDGECVQHGARIENSMSLPQVLSVAPNSAKTVTFDLDLKVNCELKMRPEMFIGTKRDQERAFKVIKDFDPIDVL